jgi:hypothetical integral membrane protein (TIGR02206 family)
VRTRFHAFGLAHLLVLVLVPLLAAALAGAERRYPHRARSIRYGVAALLVLCALSYYGTLVAYGERIFPSHLPLELCDLSLFLVIFTLFTGNRTAFDVAYYWALVGTSMALLTPDLMKPTALDEVEFFAYHGLVVVAVLYLVWSGQARPRPRSVWRALLAVNIAAAFVGAFDYRFKTDYMFLRSKPPTASLLNLFGPWPWYILSCEAAALVLFGLLYWPFRRPSRAAASMRSHPGLW